MLHWTYDHPDLPDAIVRLDERRYHYFDGRGVTRVFDLKVDDAGRFPVVCPGVDGPSRRLMPG